MVQGDCFIKTSFAPLRLCVSIVLLFSGCSSGNSISETPSAKPLAGVKLKLVVVDDPAIAAAVRGLKDEWNSQTGAELSVTECKEKDLAEAQTLPGDAVICPAYMLAPLAEANAPGPGPA